MASVAAVQTAELLAADPAAGRPATATTTSSDNTSSFHAPDPWLDTPGHPDFIAEVERSLAVLDAAVLTVSSVEGPQPQTVAIWRALRRIGVPAVVFLHKVDRRGADVDRVMAQVRQRLGARPVMLTRVTGQSGCDVRVRFSGTLTACIERVASTGVAEERVRARQSAPGGAGVAYRGRSGP